MGMLEKWGVVVGDERVVLQAEVAELVAVGLLEHLVRQRKALPITGGRAPVSPVG